MKLAALLLVSAWACHSGTATPITPAPSAPKASVPTPAPKSTPSSPTSPKVAWPERFGSGPKIPTTGFTFADPKQSSAHVEVTAKLVGIDAMMPMCGILHAGSLVEYEVVSVSSGTLVGQHFLALVGCIDLPRPSYDTNAGTLTRFKIGDTHKLLISTQRADSRGMSDIVGPTYFYLISADPA